LDAGPAFKLLMAKKLYARFRAGVNMKFFVDGPLVSAKGMLAYPQLMTDFLIEKTLGQQCQDFMFTRR